LNPLALPSSVPMGESVLLRPLAGASEVTVRMPDGSQRDFSLERGAVSFAETQQAGRYTVQWRGETEGEALASFNVNVSSHIQSDVTPSTYSFGQGLTTRGLLQAPVPGLQLWPYLVLLMLSLLTVEWVYFSRRS
jgi:hypothetical protein